MTKSGLSLRWGILGAARIAQKAVIPAIREQGGDVRVIGASSLARAQACASELNIPVAVEGYQALLERDDVDAVYIPLSNGLHFAWALACARLGKHCLCEKPMALSAHEARELHDAFNKAGVRLMEAFMWRHHRHVHWALEQLIRGEIGELRRIHGAFSFTLDRPDDYRWRDEQGGGALWDIGCYCVNAMRLFFGSEPLLVSARSTRLREHTRTDRSTVGWLDFGEDKLGVFECSFTSSYAQQFIITGTQGSLTLRRPIAGWNAPTSAILEVQGETTQHDFQADNSYLNMVEHFTRAVLDASFALHPAEDGLAQALVMEALAASAANHGSPVEL